MASEAFFASGFLPLQQSVPETAIARHNEVHARLDTPCFDGNP